MLYLELYFTKPNGQLRHLIPPSSLLCKIKNRNLGWTSDERHILEYLLKVPETPIQMSGPHTSTHVVPGGNYIYTTFTHQYLLRFN